MPLGWPMSIDGAVRQFCMHKRDTIQELNSMLAEFNLQRSSVEINRNTNLWAHNAVWNKKSWTPLQDNHYSSYGMPQNITSAGRRPDPGMSLRKRSAKWLERYNTSHQRTHLTTSSCSTWADRNAIKPPPERGPDKKGSGGVGTNNM